MNLQLEIIEGKFCLIDMDSQEYWLLFPASPYDNLSKYPVYIKSTATPVSVLEIYADFFRSLLQAPSSLNKLPYFLIGAHFIRELMTRNQGLCFMAAGRNIAGMADALSKLVHSFDVNSNIFLIETESEVGANQRVARMPLKEYLPLLHEGSVFGMILDAELLRREGEDFFADVIWSISEGGSLVVYGDMQDGFLREHPFLQDFSGQEFAGFLIAFGRVDTSLRERVRAYTGSARKEAELAGIAKEFEKLKPLMERLLVPEENMISYARPGIRNLVALEKKIAGYYPNLKDLDLKWDTNRLKEALLRLLLALEDARPEMILNERETLHEMWEEYEKKLLSELEMR
ncbi:MAG: hypothetical protein HFI66_09065 [Lachnospiraceae bacterium]|jgi:hypothetical protein|nr:hypothetical protein [Lachnospiraceae bacterium]